jgi:hypothetical protein
LGKLSPFEGILFAHSSQSFHGTGWRQQRSQLALELFFQPIADPGAV